jgi:8-oxo-dGTP diphosphatase
VTAPIRPEGTNVAHAGGQPPHGAFRYCPYCAAELVNEVTGGRVRGMCRRCGFIQYRNPVVGVAVVVRDDESRVLLGRRRGSYAGKWCIPCGYVEWDEDIRDAARREFLEETGLQVQLGGVVAVHSNFHNPRLHTVGVWLRGEVVDGQLAPGDDLDEARYFELDAVPEDLAFPTDRMVLDLLRGESRASCVRDVAVEGDGNG